MGSDTTYKSDRSHCPSAIADTIELCTKYVWHRFIENYMYEKHLNYVFFYVYIYLWMTCHHAIFANIDTVIEAKLIGYLTLRTFAQTHYNFP